MLFYLEIQYDVPPDYEYESTFQLLIDQDQCPLANLKLSH